MDADALRCVRSVLYASSPTALRDALFRLERGVCVMCKLDCEALMARLRPLRSADAVQRERIILAVEPKFGLPENAARLARLLDSSRSGCV